MAISDISRPLTHVESDARVDYLKRVLALTALGLMGSGAAGVATAAVLYLLGSAGVTIVFHQFFMLFAILGSYGIAQYAAPRLVFSGTSSKWLGFGVGVVFQGIAMGYLLLAAILMTLGPQPLLLPTALGLTALTGIGMTAYVWTGPKDFSFIKAGLSALFLPMLILMGVSFVFPSLFGGPLGIALSAVFVVVSGAGLLYQVNQVMHRLRTDQYVEGAYLITMGVLILFWNILSLLMRLNRR
ncbi:MAG: Bax inhibitor-1 family protein [Alphaproteobacteria bacterium]|nr:Bax inhibitor-1 family protein [Alphaproteobacteria bacterium]